MELLQAKKWGISCHTAQWLLKPWPHGEGKSGPGHGVGTLKMSVSTICSQALGVPFFNSRGQTIWKNQDRVKMFVC
jgi:hypothetical protein